MKIIFKVIQILIGSFFLLFSIAGVAVIIEDGFDIGMFIFAIVAFIPGILLISSSIKKKGSENDKKDTKDILKLDEHLDEVKIELDTFERIDFSKKSKRREIKSISDKKSRQYKKAHPDSGLYKVYPTKPKMSSNNYSASVPTYTPIESDDVLDFEDLNESTINKMIAKIEIEEDKAWNYHNPDDVVTQLKKAIELAKQLEVFCQKGGFGGCMYYSSYLSDNEKYLTQELQQYLDKDYDRDMEDYLEHVEYDKKIKSINRKIINLIKTNKVVYQKDLYGHFDNDDKSIIINCLNKLVKSGKINKIKSGNTNKLEIL